MGWELADRFELAQRAAARRPGTVRLYRYWLDRAADATGTAPGDVTTAALVEWLAQDGWSPETRKSARTAVRAFFRWAHASGLVPDDPAAGLPAVTVPAASARPAPDAVIVQALGSAPRRTRRMIQLGALLGLRACEIAALHSTDLGGDTLRVNGKGGKVRQVPVTDPGLLLWLRQQTGWVFPSPRGGHLTPGHVTRLVSDALPDGWTAHTLRHRMATVSYADTRDLLSVGAVLGHTRTETTRRYIRLPDDGPRAAVAAAGRLTA